MAKKHTAPEPDTPRHAEYTVVARRYRPQQFAELIGQEHVAQSLVNALQSGRVAHAYLFTGARGVGKTSAARILAKALNCESGTTATPCDACASCKAIAEGQGVDVVEIDGASNRGIEDARELRQGVAFRPTTSRYKIYIIDEVHMLTREAFNALLKTLEEPPPHVKFIFATTEVQKIPITILSRCQRFDFANVGPGKIFEQLKRIVEREGHQADDEALQLVARRAAGSMRDSQSLLDQLLASSKGTLTAEHVHAVLGTAGEEVVAELASAILAHDARTALNLVAASLDRGLQIGELVEQLVEHWRSLMLLRCAPDLRELPVTPSQREVLLRQVGNLSLDTILAGLDVWASTQARLRTSSHTQVLLEMAVVRLCRMEELLSIGQLVQALSQSGNAITVAAPGQNGSASARAPEGADPSKKNGLIGGNGASPRELQTTVPLTPGTVEDVWGRLIRYLSDKAPSLAHHLKSADLPAIFGPNSLALRFHSSYSHAYEACAAELNTAKIQDGLRRITGQPVVVKLELVSGPTPHGTRARPEPATNAAADRKKQLMALPLFQKAAEVLGGQIWHADEGFNPAATAPKPATVTEDEAEDEPAPETGSDPDEG